MYFLLFFAILILIYIGSFKDSFTQENITKLTPILFASVAIVVILSIISAVL